MGEGPSHHLARGVSSSPQRRERSHVLPIPSKRKTYLVRPSKRSFTKSIVIGNRPLNINESYPTHLHSKARGMPFIFSSKHCHSLRGTISLSPRCLALGKMLPSLRRHHHSEDFPIILVSHGGVLTHTLSWSKREKLVEASMLSSFNSDVFLTFDIAWKILYIYQLLSGWVVYWSFSKGTMYVQSLYMSSICFFISQSDFNNSEQPNNSPCWRSLWISRTTMSRQNIYTPITLAPSMALVILETTSELMSKMGNPSSFIKAPKSLDCSHILYGFCKILSLLNISPSGFITA